MSHHCSSRHGQESGKRTLTLTLSGAHQLRVQCWAHYLMIIVLRLDGIQNENESSNGQDNRHVISPAHNMNKLLPAPDIARGTYNTFSSALSISPLSSLHFLHLFTIPLVLNALHDVLISFSMPNKKEEHPPRHLQQQQQTTE